MTQGTQITSNRLLLMMVISTNCFNNCCYFVLDFGKSIIFFIDLLQLILFFDKKIRRARYYQDDEKYQQQCQICFEDDTNGNICHEISKLIIIIKYQKGLMNFSYEISYNDQCKSIEEREIKENIVFSDDLTSKIVQSQKISSKTKKKMNTSKNYYWSDTQNRRYVKFLIAKRALFELQQKERKKRKLNKQMSKTIQSRNSSQCHSHHQKMKTRYGSIDQIIRAFSHLLKKDENKVENISGSIISEQFRLDQKPQKPNSNDDLAQVDNWKEYLQPQMFEQNQSELQISRTDIQLL